MEEGMLVDYHIHTYLCGHAEGEPLEYVREAERKGVSEIGFSDHIMVDKWRPEYAMKITQVEEYVKLVETVEKQSSIPIKLGAEIDYFPGREGEIGRIMEEFPFDYTIGSVHFLGDWVIDDPRYVDEYYRRDINEVYIQYFSIVEKMVSSGLFDIVGHLDIVKKFGFKPTIDITPIVSRILRKIKVNGLCVEINTAGLEKPAKEVYPSEWILRMCKEMEIPATLGSDSHKPWEVGRHFNVALNLMRKVGYRQIATFSRRKLELKGLNFQPSSVRS